jgi:hypothetical protein
MVVVLPLVEPLSCLPRMVVASPLVMPSLLNMMAGCHIVCCHATLLFALADCHVVSNCTTLLFALAGCCVTLPPPLTLNAPAGCDIASRHSTLLFALAGCHVTPCCATTSQCACWLSRFLPMRRSLVCSGWLSHHSLLLLLLPTTIAPLSHRPLRCLHRHSLYSHHHP